MGILREQRNALSPFIAVECADILAVRQHRSLVRIHQTGEQ